MYVLLYKQEWAREISVVYVSPQVRLHGPVTPSSGTEAHQRDDNCAQYANACNLFQPATPKTQQA